MNLEEKKKYTQNVMWLIYSKGYIIKKFMVFVLKVEYMYMYINNIYLYNRILYFIYKYILYIYILKKYIITKIHTHTYSIAKSFPVNTEI